MQRTAAGVVTWRCGVSEGATSVVRARAGGAGVGVGAERALELRLPRSPPPDLVLTPAPECGHAYTITRKRCARAAVPASSLIDFIDHHNIVAYKYDAVPPCHRGVNYFLTHRLSEEFGGADGG
ncbi:hypothetical protein EVAR_92686_1 [Eumeta japonica]|uniref:Uncharacterized protein n=1 Tax=Eumeta variegata TaxID=151549 RepID=A0A4C1SZY7_EUMVA|nr:hypothetical protein EVAR_92686_1 [Eumeta japonica]